MPFILIKSKNRCNVRRFLGFWLSMFSIESCLVRGLTATATISEIQKPYKKTPLFGAFFIHTEKQKLTLIMSSSKQGAQD